MSYDVHNIFDDAETILPSLPRAVKIGWLKKNIISKKPRCDWRHFPAHVDPEARLSERMRFEAKCDAEAEDEEALESLYVRCHSIYMTCGSDTPTVVCCMQRPWRMTSTLRGRIWFHSVSRRRAIFCMVNHISRSFLPGDPTSLFGAGRKLLLLCLPGRVEPNYILFIVRNLYTHWIGVSHFDRI